MELTLFMDVIRKSWLAAGLGLILAAGCTGAGRAPLPPGGALNPEIVRPADAMAAAETPAPKPGKRTRAEPLAEGGGVLLRVADQHVPPQPEALEPVPEQSEDRPTRAEAAARKAAERQAAREAKVAADQQAAAEKQTAKEVQAATARQAAEEKKAAQEAKEAAKRQAAEEKKAVEAARRSEVARLKAERNQELAVDFEIPPGVGEHVLQPGDEIDIQVYREPDLSGVFRVLPSGNIRHPLAGTVSMAGKTAKQAEADFTGLLARDYLVHPRVIIQVTSAQSAQIVLLGQVQKPGVYPLPMGESMTLLQAIAGAGGFTDLASPDRVRIVRRRPDGRTTTLRVRVSSLLAGKGRDQDVPLEPNDVIMVPEVVF
jgi:protein involved in polysaccharide export with SLBB domain